VSRDELAARLLVALERGDEVALATLLDRDAVMLIDTGDPAGGSVRGRARVARALRAAVAGHPDAALELVSVNHGPGLALRLRDRTVVGVLVIDLGTDGTIGELWLCAAPGKLANWNRESPAVD
jgi:hypothetical protein